MSILYAKFSLSFPEKNSKLTIILNQKSFKNNIVRCEVTDLKNEFPIHFCYNVEPLNILTDVTTFVEIIDNNEHPQFWIGVADLYQEQLTYQAKELEKKFYHITNEKCSELFDENSKNMACLSRRIIDVLS